MAKRQKDKQRSTKHTYKTKDRVTRTSLKPGGELRSSERVSSSCSTSDTCRLNLVTNPVKSHEQVKDREVFTTSVTYPWSFVTQIFHNGHWLVEMWFHYIKFQIVHMFTCYYYIHYRQLSLTMEWVSDCCLMPTKQFFSYISGTNFSQVSDDLYRLN